LKNQNLGEIKPFIIKKKAILSLDERWLNYFDSEQNFKVVINDNKIMLIGPRIVQDPTTKKPTPAKMEVSNV